MPTLPAGHLEIAMLFIARRYCEAIRRPERRRLDARHIAVSRKLILWHIQPVCDKGGQGMAERVPDARGIALPPSARCNAARLVLHMLGYAPCARAEQIFPISI